MADIPPIGTMPQQSPTDKWCTTYLSYEKQQEDQHSKSMEAIWLFVMVWAMYVISGPHFDLWILAVSAPRTGFTTIPVLTVSLSTLKA